MAKEAINIKGTRQGLAILLDPNKNFEEMKSELIFKMEKASGFFSGAKFTLHGVKNLFPEEKSQLEAICQEYGLIPSTDVPSPRERHIIKAPESPKKTTNVPAAGELALLVKRTLRSGQRVAYEGHITILGDVNPGAEVVAGGNIIIMGTCSGFIHAGANNNRKSYIITIGLHNAQIRINEKVLFKTPEHLHNGPYVACIEENNIIYYKLDRSDR
ncbi:septum site-determining protein MinC [Desulfotruncus alcoholivorax]|uniref:septum site-determining protein MinC n=1 Tax=Desulfotruncus alcoholivorax TaxID=265477 RepID=UPI0005524F4F|nr:septum site-determining protein MinC [Desulfotruncus alcoholivorax]